jgi:hypothetical protein
LLPASFPLPHIKRAREAKTKVEQAADREVPPAAESAEGDVVMQEAGADEGGPAAGTAAEGEDWLLEAVLDSGGACVYCGGRFALAMWSGLISFQVLSVYGHEQDQRERESVELVSTRICWVHKTRAALSGRSAEVRYVHRREELAGPILL